MLAVIVNSSWYGTEESITEFVFDLSDPKAFDYLD